jgi:hypothetical protein
LYIRARGSPRFRLASASLLNSDETGKFHIIEEEPAELVFPLGINAKTHPAGEKSLMNAILSLEMQVENSVEPALSDAGIPVCPLVLSDREEVKALYGDDFAKRIFPHFRGIEGEPYSDRYGVNILDWAVEAGCRNGIPFVFAFVQDAEIFLR